MSDVVKAQANAVTRSLKVLSALIKQEVEAADKASQPHWLKVGEYLLEAKSQMPHSEFIGWFEGENFGFSIRHAQRYMAAVPATLSIEKRRGARVPETWSSGQRAAGYEPRGTAQTEWKEEVQEKLESFDWERYNQDQAEKAKERGLIKKLALEMIDIGFKVLAVKLHPDKTTGSKEAMNRLNEARRFLKEKLQ